MAENQKIKQVVVNAATYDVEDMYAARTNSPTFIGIPKAPDYDDATNSSQLVTVAYMQRYVATAINAAINAAIAAAY